ncbi:MAG: anthranilate synthase component I [Candidatus Omnitrophota bacterium]
MDIIPSKKDFLIKARGHNLIVFSRKMYCDYLTPVSIYHKVAKISRQESFLLESVEGEEKISRFSFIGFRPLAVFKSRQRRIFVDMGNRREQFDTKDDPLKELNKLIKRFKVWPKEAIRFFGGFVGYVGYDYVRFYEPVGKPLKDKLNDFDTYFILPRFLIIFDHLKKEIEILSLLFLKDKKNLGDLYYKEVSSFNRTIDSIFTPVKLPLLKFFPRGGGLKKAKKNIPKVSSNFKRKDFLAAVKKTKNYIRQGEIIQAVLSQRFAVSSRADSFLVYRYLRLLNPSPYMYYLNLKKVKVVGSSPEMLLRCEKNELTTRPIAGTRRRGKTDREDVFLAKELLADYKERAEHVMLVDLGRNDLGRVAKKGSVTIPIFMRVEKFSHVMHIVSEVRALLDKRQDMFASLKACFPAGTVTGAPKVRAMQIINQLEPDKRGIYAGCIGYFSFTKSLDTCIIIRTILFKDNKAYVQSGAGIVADSIPSREYQETVNKAFAQIAALRMAGQK